MELSLKKIVIWQLRNGMTGIDKTNKAFIVPHQLYKVKTYECEDSHDEK